jgi:hypothetical protein
LVVQRALAAVPTEATIQKDLYVSRAGRLLFREGKSGIASFICPISDGSLEGEKGQHLRSLFLTYRDQDGPGPSPSGGPSEVHANLRRVRKSDGHVDTLPNSLVSSRQEDAPSSGVDVWATHQSAHAGKTLSHRIDFSNHFYYVHITMKKDPGGGGVGVLGVALQE